jgi:hypothetical protein
MSLSKKRESEIYDVVHGTIMRLRIAIAGMPQYQNRGNDWDALDAMISKAGHDAASAAVRAARGAESTGSAVSGSGQTLHTEGTE